MQNLITQTAEFFSDPLFCVISRVYLAGRCFNDVEDRFKPLPEMRMSLETIVNTWLLIRQGEYLLVIDCSHANLPNLN